MKNNYLYGFVLAITLLGSLSSFLVGCWSAKSAKFSSDEWSVSDHFAVKVLYVILVFSSIFGFIAAALLFVLADSFKREEELSSPSLALWLCVCVCGERDRERVERVSLND